jgi:hypothetical protein
MCAGVVVGVRIGIESSADWLLTVPLLDDDDDDDTVVVAHDVLLFGT